MLLYIVNDIRTKDRDAVIRSLRAGVVPRAGVHLIQTGRRGEIEAVLRDIESIADGGSAVKFVIGEYGAGKTFFLNLAGAVAMEKGLVTANADLTPEKRLHATGGYAQALYREIMRNLSTRTKSDGGAVNAVVERFITEALRESKETGRNLNTITDEKLHAVSEAVYGYDFAEVISAYRSGSESGNDEKKIFAVRWLRGEYAAKTEARRDLGVRIIIDDNTWYDVLKIFAIFTRLAGYKGLLVRLDEMVNIYRLHNKQARASNYEQILRIVNDGLQGTASGLGFLMGGTPEFQLDTRRGMFGYDALRRRLGENAFAKQGNLVDFSGPVLRLSCLSREELFVLLEKIRLLYASGDEEKAVLPKKGISDFMNYCERRLGNDYFRTPGTTITAFVNLLAVLEQNPGANPEELLASVRVAPEKVSDDDDLVEM